MAGRFNLWTLCAPAFVLVLLVVIKTQAHALPTNPDLEGKEEISEIIPSLNQTLLEFNSDAEEDSFKAENIEYEGAYIQTEEEDKLVPIEPNHVYHVRRRCILEGSAKVLKTERIRRTVISIYSSLNVKILDLQLSPVDTTDAGQGYNRINFRTQANLPAGAEYTLSKAVITITTSKGVTVKETVQGPFTVVVGRNM